MEGYLDPLALRHRDVPAAVAVGRVEPRVHGAGDIDGAAVERVGSPVVPIEIDVSGPGALCDVLAPDVGNRVVACGKCGNGGADLRRGIGFLTNQGTKSPVNHGLTSPIFKPRS